MLFTVFALVLALVSPATPVADGCADVVVVGVRGSGQAPGFGDQVAPVIEELEAAIEGRGLSVRSVALEYPAISVSDSFGLVLLTGDYDRSVRAGVDSLRATFDASRSSCPATEFVLVGYSQGAQVIKTALAGTPPTIPIAAVVLLADPTRDSAQRGIVRLGDPSVERNGTFGAIALPHHVGAVTTDVCATGDGVCERGRQSFTAHTEGYGDAGLIVLPYVLAEFDSRLRFSSSPR